MRALALHDRSDLDVRSLAQSLERVGAACPLMFDTFLRYHWRKLPDPSDAEYVRSPGVVLREAQERYSRGGAWDLAGDCDDAATFAACVLGLWGFSPWLVAIRLPGEAEYSHVFCRVSDGDNHWDIDPIVPRELLPITGVDESLMLEVGVS